MFFSKKEERSVTCRTHALNAEGCKFKATHTHPNPQIELGKTLFEDPGLQVSVNNSELDELTV